MALVLYGWRPVVCVRATAAGGRQRHCAAPPLKGDGLSDAAGTGGTAAPPAAVSPPMGDCINAHCTLHIAHCTLHSAAPSAKPSAVGDNMRIGMHA